ncbi:MAG: hypothetical protein IJL24_05080, partial [Treponema sp.]|nr:hypothetical protein [Treponema sp.]
LPGEHHFVAIYLLSKFNRIPDYINPDGTKGICGDIVFENKEKTFSIEVKIGKTSFSFSKNETNSWFINKKPPFPNYLIALTKNYLFIIKWKKFSDTFIGLKEPKRIESKSGNSKKISEKELLMTCNKEAFKIEPKGEEKINDKFKILNAEIEKVFK